MIEKYINATQFSRKRMEEQISKIVLTFETSEFV
jgi:hypothetical protein